jgi:glutamate-ammonia-ligase adenylyltransferase
MDVEFLVQLLQLKHGRDFPGILQPNAWDALAAIATIGLLSPEDATSLLDAYSFLRLVEARLRIVTDRPLNEVPERAEDREKLARRLGFEAGAGQSAADRFTTELTRVTVTARGVYQKVLEQSRSGKPAR